MNKAVRKKFSFLTDKEFNILAKLDTPQKVQDYVSNIPQNFEKNGEQGYTVVNEELSADFGLTKGTIQAMKEGRTWGHVT